MIPQFSCDCPEHYIISDLVQDIHKEELMDDLLSISSSDSFEEAKGNLKSFLVILKQL